MVRSQELKSAVFSDFLVSGGGGGVGCPPNFHAEEDGMDPPSPPPLFCSTTCTETEFSLQYQYKIKETGDVNKERYQLN